MKRIIGMPSNGPNLSDTISEHFGHCNYYVGVEIDENSTFKLAFSIPNHGHSGCMEPVLNMKEREVTEMIVRGVGGRPYMGFIQLGIKMCKGINGTLKENIETYLEGNLQSLKGPACGNQGASCH
jgi:predicted Fe-Mo cluster-binding NifX family protein